MMRYQPARWPQARHNVEMTGIPLEGGADDRQAGPGPAAVSPGEGGPARSTHWRGAPAVGRSIWFLEHLQDVVTVTVGLILIALAAVLLISGIIDFADGTYGSISTGGPLLLDRVLLVLILIEIVHTVVLSLRAHQLVAQPFIVVGLIAVIRRILFVLTPGSHIGATTSELALLIGMVAVFVAGLIAVSIFERKSED